MRWQVVTRDFFCLGGGEGWVVVIMRMSAVWWWIYAHTVEVQKRGIRNAAS